jgi:hypothetical protein
MDSLQSKLDSLPLDFARGKQAKAAGQIAKAEEKAAKIASRIDSLRNNLQGFENLGGLRAGDKLGLEKAKVPALPTEDSSKVGISQLKLQIPGGDLKERIDEQIRNLGGK